MKKISVLLSVLVLGGFNISYAMAAEKKSDADFLKSYKASFLDSCIESSGGAQYKATCECVLNELLNNFSVDQLKDNKLTSDFIENVAMKKCDQ